MYLNSEKQKTKNQENESAKSFVSQEGGKEKSPGAYTSM
ncbi:hypothetical protein CSB69_0096 [Morganella morganii]|nr:hypothetical protein CSB69_0096 [Morganella morganii]EMP51984.1 hypothetical protein C790_00454 [Morganella morganii SC01]